MPQTPAGREDFGAPKPQAWSSGGAPTHSERDVPQTLLARWRAAAGFAKRRFRRGSTVARRGAARLVRHRTKGLAVARRSDHGPSGAVNIAMRRYGGGIFGAEGGRKGHSEIRLPAPCRRDQFNPSLRREAPFLKEIPLSLGRPCAGHVRAPSRRLNTCVRLRVIVVGRSTLAVICCNAAYLRPDASGNTELTARVDPLLPAGPSRPRPSLETTLGARKKHISQDSCP